MTKYDAPALDKGLDILEFLSRESHPQSQQEIARGINRTANEIYRMLVSLESRGYILKDPASGKYRLTLRLYQMAHNHSPVDTIVKASEMHMEKLAMDINQSCHLSVIFQNQLLIIAQARSMTPVSLSVEVGGLFPILKTNSGMVFLAHMNKEERVRVLEGSKDYHALTKRERDAVHKELDGFRGLECSVRDSELTDGVTDFSCPILGNNSEVLAVLAVSTLTSQMRKLVSHNTIKKELKKTIVEIRKSLGVENL